MKTKWSFIYILVLVATLLSLSTSPAQAAKVIPCPNPGDYKLLSQSGASFTFCVNNSGVVDTYVVKMIRSYETDYITGSIAKGSTTYFRNLPWTWTPGYSDTEVYYYNLYTGSTGPWLSLNFEFIILPYSGAGHYNLTVTEYRWLTPGEDKRLVFESETKKNGVSLGIMKNSYDHFEGTLIIDGCPLFR